MGLPILTGLAGLLPFYRFTCHAILEARRVWCGGGLLDSKRAFEDWVRALLLAGCGGALKPLGVLPGGAQALGRRATGVGLAGVFLLARSLGPRGL